jgi:hypothetical protein
MAIVCATGPERALGFVSPTRCIVESAFIGWVVGDTFFHANPLLGIAGGIATYLALVGISKLHKG